MDLKTIHTKTAKGVTQINQKTASLSRDLMKVLKFVDGKSSVSELSSKADLPVPILEKALASLVREGYIRVFESRTENTGFGDEDDFDFTAPAKQGKGARPAPPPAPGAPGAPAPRPQSPQAAQEDAAALAAAREKVHAETRARAEREAQIRARLDVEARAKAEAEQRAIEEARRVQEAAERARLDVESKVAEEKKRKEALSDTRSRMTREQLAREEEESKIMAGLRAKAEAEAKALGEARARADAEAQALAAARAQAEAAAKTQAAAAADAHKELRAQLKEEIETRIRAEIQEKMRGEIEEQTRGEMEKAILEDAKEEARVELERRLNEENASLTRASEEATRKAEEQTRLMLAEQETRLRAEMERRIKAETEGLQRASLEAKIRAERETSERVELEERLKAESEARQRVERDSQERQEAEARNRARLEARAREDAEQRARLEAEMKSRLETEQRAKYEAEARAKLEAEERMRLAAANAAELETERRAREEAELKAETELRARMIATKAANEQAEARARIEAETEGLLDKERRAREKAEAKARANEEAEEREREEQVKRLRALSEQAELNRQAREAEELQPEHRPRARKKKRSAMYWLTRVAIVVVVLFVAALLVVQVIPLGGITAKVQRGLAAWLHDDVSVTGVRIALLPRPHLKVDGVAVGKLLDVKATSGTIQLDLGTLFDDSLQIDTLELNNLSLPADAVSRIAQWARTEGRPANVQIGRVVLTNAKLELKGINLDAFNADLRFDKGVLRRAVIKASDNKWNFDAKPDGDHWALELTARLLALPVGTPIPLEDLRAKGTLTGSELVVPEFEATVLKGALNGSLRADWTQGVNLNAELTVKQMQLGDLFELYTRDIQMTGRVEGAFSVNASAPAFAELLAAPKVQGNFSVKDGSVSNVDLVQAMRSPESGGRGGATKFSELAGALQTGGGEVHYNKLKLTGGVLLANGDVALLSNDTLTGRLTVEIRSSVAQDRGAFTVGGTVQKPQLRRGG